MSLNKTNKMNHQSIIIINPYCHQQLGWQRWQSIKQDVLKTLVGPVKEIVVERGLDLNTSLIAQLKLGGCYCLISAGGDGSMNYMINCLLKLSLVQRENIVIGAVGLGSSNDFLKPFRRMIRGIPVRINLNGPIDSCDLGYVEYHNHKGDCQSKYFVVNASFGLTAAANYNFNHPGRVLKFLKATSTSGAIAYTAIDTIFKHQNITCSIEYDGVTMKGAVSNINILKRPYVSGSLWYRQDITADDGKLGMHICRDMNQINLLKVLLHLSKGKFVEGKKTMSRVIRSFRLAAEQPVVFECDGETELVSDIRISVVPSALKFLMS
jgi:diacylglycerol kinase (ATP)